MHSGVQDALKSFWGIWNKTYTPGRGDCRVKKGWEGFFPLRMSTNVSGNSELGNSVSPLHSPVLPTSLSSAPRGFAPPLKVAIAWESSWAFLVSSLFSPVPQQYLRDG